MGAAPVTDIRPALRGQIHRYAAFAAVPLFAGLTLAADSTKSRVACAIYGLGVTTMLGVSAVYHSARTSPTWRSRLQRVDHSTILLAIAGSYTGIGVLALEGAPERWVLTIAWVAATIGIALRMTWLHAPYPVIAVVYVVVGWSVLFQLGPFIDALSGADLFLIAAGGVLYTAGAVVYALHRPNPWPMTFGYHEIFHALVVAAALLHFVAAARLV